VFTLVAGVKRSAHKARVIAGSKAEGLDEIVAQRQSSGSHVLVLMEEVDVHMPRVVGDRVVGHHRSQLGVVVNASLSGQRWEEQGLVAGLNVRALRHLHIESRCRAGHLSTSSFVRLVQGGQLLVASNN
jgi:hypothetical protein